MTTLSKQNTLGVDSLLPHMTSRLFSEPFPYRGDNNDSDSTKQQHTPDHLYQTSSSSSEGSSIMSSSKYATAAFVASSAGLGASDIDSMYNNMVRPEDLLDSLHHHLQLQQQQQHQSQHHHQQQQRLRQQQHHHLQSSADRMQDLDLWSSAFDPCSVPSTSSSLSSAAIAPLTTIAEATPTYLSFLPSFSSLPPGVPSFLPTSSSAAGDENGHHYFIDSSAGLMMESRQSTPPGHDHSSSSSSSSSSASSSKSSSSSASSSLVSSPTSTYFDESAVMLPAITACASCKRSHIKCDSGRPCQNCLKHPPKALTCRDATPKPRGRPKGGSKAAAEAIMLARLYQQQQQQHQLHLQEQLHRHHQQQQQPGYVPRPRVMSLPQRPTRSTYQVVPTVPHQHRYLSSQGSPQSVSLDYHAHSRSSPASPATLEHRVIRLGRRPSLPVWNHPYAMHRSSSSSGPNSSASSSSPVIAPPVVPSSSHTAMTTSMGANTWAGFFSSSTLGLTSMAQEFSYPPSIGSPNGSRGVVLAHQQGLDSMSLMQQQHRVAAAPLALRGTALCRQTSITENNDNVPQAWLALQMLQASLPSSSSMPLVSTAAPLVAVSSSPAVSPCPSAVSTFSSASTTTAQLMTFKQRQHAFSEEREMIKEEEEEEEGNMCVGSNDMGITFNPIGYSHHDHDSEEECEREQKKEEEEEREEGRCRMEAMLQHEMQFELQFLQQRQQLLQYQQEQVQREQTLVRLNLQKQRNVSSHQLYPYPQQQNGHGPVPFF